MFDANVISGEVGMRKPEPEIFAHALDLLGVEAKQTVFVDDLRVNVTAAVELGFVGVHHVTYDETASELEALFGLPLRE
jgi:putative hydrolase of the HAD superfamily